MGRDWQMPVGNLAMSGLVRPRPGEGNPAELGFVVALALHDVVSRFVDPGLLQLKWPNDVLLAGAKLSGILLEREGDVLVLGIGVNLVAAPPLPDRPTAAVCDHGPTVAAAEFAELLAEAFAKRRAAWRHGGFAAIRTDWLQRAHPPGTELLVNRDGARIGGRFAGLADDGALHLLLPDGALYVVHAGDVWLAPAAGEGG